MNNIPVFSVYDQVHSANTAAHDAAARLHDHNVPYISRPATRKYYWSLIQHELAEAGRPLLGAAVLEVGCGTGTFVECCINAGACQYDGIDLSSEMIKIAQQKHSGQPGTFCQEAVEDYARDHQQQYDIILSSSFVHHLVDPRATIEDIRKMLKPDGCYIALHEQVQDHRWTLLEHLDHRAQVLAGYSGFAQYSLPRRGYYAAIGGLAPRIGRMFARFHLATVPTKKQYNYVDYQLNDDFALHKLDIPGAVIKPYAYLGFTELLKLQQPLNHELLRVGALTTAVADL
jgi:2-polyprenyl-3-methyl-5-hydroxy-6-metoxy-1,4-benzoquinol methylase